MKNRYAKIIPHVYTQETLIGVLSIHIAYTIYEFDRNNEECIVIKGLDSEEFYCRTTETNTQEGEQIDIQIK